MTKLKKVEAHVLVCRHKTCARQGAKGSAKALKRALKEEGLGGRVMVTKVKCLDECGRGPVWAVYPDGVWYGGVDEDAARSIVREHLGRGRVVESNVMHRIGGGGE